MTSVELSKQTDLELVGAAFTPARMFAVRTMTRAAIHAIAAKCKPGMVEEAAVEMAREILASHGMVRGWHDVYVRFGTNTTKTFGAPSDPGIVLGDDGVGVEVFSPLAAYLKGVHLRYSPGGGAAAARR